jgi:N-acetylglucosaminyl-diphospho-decaprenol L-rhamnosyltransferase
MQSEVKISLSIVSHGQMEMVQQLLMDIKQHCTSECIEIILTLNLKDEVVPELGKLGLPIMLLRNPFPLGFGANHNQAFRQANGNYFCVLNPDIRLYSNPFAPLVAALAELHSGVVAPMVVGVDGQQEDSARRFPTPWSIVKRLLTGKHETVHTALGLDCRPDWVGGMFMLLPKPVYQKIQGFNIRYFMYYEDVDLCARLRLNGWNVLLCPDARVTHAAQRRSHKNLYYLRWHIASMLRFFTSATFVRLWSRGLL